LNIYSIGVNDIYLYIVYMDFTLERMFYFWIGAYFLERLFYFFLDCRLTAFILLGVGLYGFLFQRLLYVILAI